MPITKQKVLSEVNIITTQDANGNPVKVAGVKWLNKILEDGNVLSSVPHRGTYSEAMKAQFLADVEGGDNYLAALGWV